MNSAARACGLRHTVAVILRECGYDERTIADALGQKTIERARLYARGVDLTNKMTDVAKKFGPEVKVSNLSRRVSNPRPSPAGVSKGKPIHGYGRRISYSINVVFQFVSRGCGRIRTH